MHSKRPQSTEEEVLNSISHAFAGVLAVAAVPFLMVKAIASGSAAAVVGVSVFSLTMVLLYVTSAIYHALTHERAKGIFQVLDHSAIYLLIAGSSTPFTLVVLRGSLGWLLFGVIWGLALAGVLLKALAGAHRFHRLSLLLYILMGWLMVFAIKPLWQGMPGWGFFWLIAGGVAYTVGVGFYAAHKVRYAHFVWHLFVMAGTASHVAAVMLSLPT